MVMTVVHIIVLTHSTTMQGRILFIFWSFLIKI
jgi:hypothetical protein